MQAYFRTDPYYQDLFSDVWLWWEYPQRGNSGDIGVDLVAKERISGELWAIQCKFYHPEHTLSKSDVDSFLAASGKAEFSHRLLVSTTDRWSENLNKTLDNQKVPVHRLTVHDLANSPIDWEQFSSDTIPTGSQRLQDAKGSYSLKRLPRKELRPHQQIAVDNVIAGLQTADRGKLIMACGTGKTFTALKIAERMVGKGGRVLFLVPSISLLSQSLREWTAEAEIPLHPIAVCSDVKVGRRTDSEDLKASDLPFPATTDSEKIRKGAAATNKMTVIFSTEENITLCSMDEEAIYGKELHRLGFGEAVRAHDDRFNAIVNKLALNQQRPPQIDVIGIGGGREDSEEIDNDLTPVQLAFHWPELEEWKEALYAKVVHKVWRSPVLGGLGQGCGHPCRSPSHAHGGHHRQKSQR